MTSPLLHLVDIANAFCGDAPAAPDEAAEFFCAAVDAYLSGQAPTLDEAFGLKPKAGRRRPIADLRRDIRDRAIIEAAARFFSCASGSGTAKATHTALNRYAQSAAWRKDQRVDHCPYPEGSQSAALWSALKAGDGRPIGVEAIRKLLVASTPFSVPANDEIDSRNGADPDAEPAADRSRRRVRKKARRS